MVAHQSVAYINSSQLAINRRNGKDIYGNPINQRKWNFIRPQPRQELTNIQFPNVNKFQLIEMEHKLELYGRKLKLPITAPNNVLTLLFI